MHHRAESVTVSAQEASLKFITKAFATRGKAVFPRAHLTFYFEFSEVYLWKCGQCDVHVYRVHVVTNDNNMFTVLFSFDLRNSSSERGRRRRLLLCVCELCSSVQSLIFL